MPLKLTSLPAALDHGFDTVIDVRSPSEFAEDHMPGAVSMPVLDDAERAEVGTLYKQVSPFTARKLGAALVFRNAAQHIETRLADREGDWRPLVYCWRGGQRSGAFTWMLSQIGWRAEVIEGGYKSYRRLVMQMLYEEPLAHRFILLGGYTGTAKTALLPLLRAEGVQVLDLEGLAQHRGSLLGEMPGGQPSQKGFETALAQALCALSPDRPVVVEAESSKIGGLNLPPSLWDAMKSAPGIDIHAPLEARAAYLAEAYADILADGDRLRDRLSPLRYHRGQALLDHWSALILAGDKRALCRSLAEDHYDPAYRRSMHNANRQVLQRFETQTLSSTDLTALAGRIATWVHSTQI